MKGSILIAGLAAAAIIALPAFAQSGPPRPEIGEPRPFELPETRTVELSNGLEMTFIEFGLAPMVNIQVRVEAGNIDDGEQTWLADLTGAMMEEGAGGRASDEIARAAAAMGGNLNVGVGIHETTLALNVLAENGPEAVALLADVVRRPDMPESELDRVRQNLIRNVTDARSRPQTVANEAYAELLYGTDHPYGHTLPTIEQLNSYTMADINRFHDENFGAARTRIYVAGRFDEAAMEAAIREAFGDWEAGEERTAEPIPPQAGPVVRIIDRPGAPQSTIRVGFPAVGPDHPDAIPLTVMNAILGGSFTSRLTQNLREEKGWTYSPGSGITNRPGSGYWTFNADIVSAQTAPALAETFGEINRMQIDLVPESEAEGMQTWISGIFILQNASTGGLINQIAFRDSYGLPDDYLETYVPRVMAVTREDIARVTTEYLDTDNLVLVVVGDEDSISDEIQLLPALSGADFIED
jgi:predicted Zn-dependent peptidase